MSIKNFSNLNPEAGPDSMSFFETLSVVKKVFFDRSSRIPKNRLPEVRPALPSFIIPSENMKFIWFGHSTLLLNVDGQIILIDPVFSETASPFSFLVKRFQAPVLRLKELPHVDMIVISHDHYDHLDEKTIRYFKNKTSKFMVPLRVGNHLRKWGINNSRITELAWGESSTDQGITYTAAPAQHFSGRGLTDRNKTLWASWIIQGQQEKIFYSGDSGYGAHFKEIGTRFGPFDFAFMENGQYNTLWPDVHMQPEESIQALIDLNAHTFIPVHWGMFDLSLHHWSEPILRLQKFMTASYMPFIAPRLGEVVDTRSYKNDFWWEKAITEEHKTPTRIHARSKLIHAGEV